jgi:hypothetical protein
MYLIMKFFHSPTTELEDVTRGKDEEKGEKVEMGRNAGCGI